MTTNDTETIVEAANRIEARLAPELVARIITWRDTELGQYDPEDVKDLGRHVV